MKNSVEKIEKLVRGNFSKVQMANIFKCATPSDKLNAIIHSKVNKG